MGACSSKPFPYGYSTEFPWVAEDLSTDFLTILMCVRGMLSELICLRFVQDAARVYSRMCKIIVNGISKLIQRCPCGPSEYFPR